MNGYVPKCFFHKMIAISCFYDIAIEVAYPSYLLGVTAELGYSNNTPISNDTSECVSVICGMVLALQNTCTVRYL